MRRNVRSTALMVLLFCSTMGSQVVRPRVGAPDADVKLFPALDLASQATAQTAGAASSEAGRAARFNRSNVRPLYNAQDPAHSDRITHIVRYQYGQPDGSLHVPEADLIVYGHIDATTPHLTPNGGNVYSTFAFSPTSAPLKGVIPSDGKLTLEREGGVVRYPSGVTRMEGIQGQGLPEPGKNYLLFLRKRGTDYNIEAGFYIDGPSPEALDARDDNSIPSSTGSLLDAIKAKAGTK